MSDGWCERCRKRPSLRDMSGHYTYICLECSLSPGLLEAVEEIKGWRDLTIKSYRKVPCQNPHDHQRVTQNQLNLLDVIISKLRKKSGEDPKKVFEDMSTWEKVGYPP